MSAVSIRFGLVIFLATVLQLAALPGPSAADEPLRPPGRHSVCSPAGAICATSDPKIGTFVHPAGAPERSRALWTLPNWYRILWVTDGGRQVITGYNGLNLVPQFHPGQTVILEFWQLGGLLKSYTLDDLGYSRRKLQKTVSHYHWGGYVGIGEDGYFRLAMLDGVRIVFDPATGALVKRQKGGS